MCPIYWRKTKSIGGCLLAAVNRTKVRDIFSINERYEIALVIALGYINEFPVSEEACGSLKYYKDDKLTLHVPKRKIENIVLNYK